MKRCSLGFNRTLFICIDEELHTKKLCFRPSKMTKNDASASKAFLSFALSLLPRLTAQAWKCSYIASACDSLRPIMLSQRCKFSCLFHFAMLLRRNCKVVICIALSCNFLFFFSHSSSSPRLPAPLSTLPPPALPSLPRPPPA